MVQPALGVASRYVGLNAMLFLPRAQKLNCMHELAISDVDSQDMAADTCRYFQIHSCLLVYINSIFLVCKANTY